MAQLDALKFDPTSTVLRQDNRSRTHKHEQRETMNEQARAARVTEGEREMQLAVVQIKAAQAAQAAQEMWTVCD